MNVKSFEFKFGSIGWERRDDTLYEFIHDKTVVEILQSTIGEYLIITIFYK